MNTPKVNLQTAYFISYDKTDKTFYVEASMMPPFKDTVILVGKDTEVVFNHVSTERNREWEVTEWVFQATHNDQTYTLRIENS